MIYAFHSCLRITSSILHAYGLIFLPAHEFILSPYGEFRAPELINQKEEVYTTTCHTFEKTQTALFEYIESFYNRKRRHSALDYKTPQQVEDEALAT